MIMSHCQSPVIFIDGRKLGDGGIGTSIEMLVYGITAQGIIGQGSGTAPLYILVTNRYLRANEGVIREWEKAGVRLIPDDCPKYSISELFYLPFKYRKLIATCDWYVTPHYVLPFFIPVKKAVFIHDVIHLQYPERLITKLVARVLIGSAIQRSDKIITVSRNSRNCIQVSFPESDSGKISIVPNATKMSPDDSCKKLETASARRLLWVGADRNHKRFGFFLDFLSKLKSARISFNARVISNLRPQSVRQIEDLDLGACVSVLSDITTEEMEREYRDADCFVTTSVEEGFCIPLLDAMRCKVPVLCPELSFARELVEDYGWYYAPSSVEDAVFQFARMVQKQEERENKCAGAYDKSTGYTPAFMGSSFLSSLGYEPGACV